MKMQANILGDVRAEHDHVMLDTAFLETPDYKTLLESSERIVVVGRRGSGKSAMTYKLKKFWEKEQKTLVIEVAPEEDEILGLRAALKVFDDNFRHLRAVGRILWRYALYVQCLAKLHSHYKFKKSDHYEEALAHVKNWKLSCTITENVKFVLRNKIKKEIDPEEFIGELAGGVELKKVESATKSMLDELNYNCIYLIDKLDEGYDPDNRGSGIVDGIVQAVIDVAASSDRIRPTVFLRDNIYRTVQKMDPDFSRNIESQVLRIHWDEYQLFNLVANRLKSAFKIDQESSLKIWNACAAHDLVGKDGFRKCLYLTLYRPRDLMILLNNGFYNAHKRNSEKIVLNDIEGSAKEISNVRLDDLHKEYSAILPGLGYITRAFSGINPEVTVDDAVDYIDDVICHDKYAPEIQQSFNLHGNALEVIKSLYSIGFLGMHDDANNNYMFCHDGRDPGKEIKYDTKLLIHPCYWMALDLTKNSLKPDEAQEIYDEYEIDVKSEEPEKRKQKIGQLISEFTLIEEGVGGAHEYEEWCLTVLSILFAGVLRNFALHPNGNSVQRRDVVATNLADEGVWKRIYDDYKVRQAIFEAKNYASIGPNEYRQMSTYLTGEYGKLGFIITRDDDINLHSGRELDWVKEIYNTQDGKLVIKLTGKFLVKLLQKIRSPQKHDAAEQALHGIMDTYVRRYLGNKSTTPSRKKKRRSK